jgi:hypothetical protein
MLKLPCSSTVRPAAVLLRCDLPIVVCPGTAMAKSRSPARFYRDPPSRGDGDGQKELTDATLKPREPAVTRRFPRQRQDRAVTPRASRKRSEYPYSKGKNICSIQTSARHGTKPRVVELDGRLTAAGCVDPHGPRAPVRTLFLLSEELRAPMLDQAAARETEHVQRLARDDYAGLVDSMPTKTRGSPLLVGDEILYGHVHIFVSTHCLHDLSKAVGASNLLLA